MTINLHACHAADHFRADVRARKVVEDRTTDRLMSEVEKTRPVLHWPMKSKTTTEKEHH